MMDVRSNLLKAGPALHIRHVEIDNDLINAR